MNEEALKEYLEKRIFSELNGRPFVVVYLHAYANRADNFPGVSGLRSIYEALPSAVRDGLQAVFFVHPGLQARLFFATFGRFLFSSGYGFFLSFLNFPSLARLLFSAVRVRVF